MKLEEAVEYAKDLLLSLPKKSLIRVIGHVDADGIASASIIAIALERSGYRYHISIKPTKTDVIKEIAEEENELIIFADIGSGYLKEMEKLKSNVIVLDHHLSYDDPPKNVMYVNSRLYGIDGSRDASASIVSYFFARAIDDENIDLCQIAITGAIGDKQDMEGYNRKVMEEGIANGFIETRDEYIFEGMTIKDALENSLEPYFTQFANANYFIEKLGIKPEKKFEELNDEERKKLLSALTLKLLEQGCSEIEWKKRMIYGLHHGNLYEMASKLNASARLNEYGTGIGACMGDKKAKERIFILREKYRDEIRKEMREMERKEPYEMKKFIYFYNDKRTLGGVIAGLSLKYLPQFKKGKPVVALSYNEEIEISARASQEMVENGINLGMAMREAASRVGGQGGGHPIAAGATIPREKEGEFLKLLDEIL